MLSTILLIIIVIVLIGLIYRFATLGGSEKKEVVDIMTEKNTPDEEADKDTSELLDKSYFLGFGNKKKSKRFDDEESDYAERWKKIGAKGEFADVVSTNTDEDPNKGKESGEIHSTISKDFPQEENDNKDNLKYEEVKEIKKNDKEIKVITDLEKEGLQKLIEEDEDIKNKYENSKPIGTKISDVVKKHNSEHKKKKDTSTKLKLSPLRGQSKHHLKSSHLDLNTLLTNTKEKKKD